MQHDDDKTLILYDYTIGYFKSIVVLLNKVKQDRILIIPLTFLISHYIELWIKTIAFFYGLVFTDFDFKSLNIDSHNLKKLILNEDQLSEFADHEIEQYEIEEIIELLDYFEKFVIKGSDLSTSMRYPFSTNNNDLIISETFYNYNDLDIEEYLDITDKLLRKSIEIHKKFFERESEIQEEILENLKDMINNNKGINL
jgi:hypothetical protein